MNDVSSLCELLISWADINSGSQNIAGLERMREVLMAEFATIPDVKVETVVLGGTAAAGVRVQQRPDAPIQILLSGHYDTVYGADHPFQTCERVGADLLRGPGVADMKGGIVVMLAALREFERSAHTGRIGWEVLLTPDEETGSVASRPVLEATAPRCDLGLIFEPARENGDIVESRKGTGIFTATCHGRAAHAGRAAGDGRNAIVALAEFLLAANRLPDDLPGVLLNIGAIVGGGAVNIVPDFAKAEINVRIAKASEAAAVVDRLHAYAAAINGREGFRLEITGQFNRFPMETNPVSDYLFQSLRQCARDVGAADFSRTHVGGGSDGNLLSAMGLPCLDGLGVIGGCLHSADEFARISSLLERAQITARLLTQLAAGVVEIPSRA